MAKPDGMPKAIRNWIEGSKAPISVDQQGRTVLPPKPSVQDIADALVALGLAVQEEHKNPGRRPSDKES